MVITVRMLVFLLRSLFHAVFLKAAGVFGCCVWPSKEYVVWGSGPEKPELISKGEEAVPGATCVGFVSALEEMQVLPVNCN